MDMEYTGDNKIDFVKIENDVQVFWDKHDIRNKFFLYSKNNKMTFSFYEGPPFATGDPHYGHAISAFIKDCFIRYKIMNGFSVNLRGGWDCHGVPIEFEVQKANNLYDKSKIEELGIIKFNSLCRSIVLRCVNTWDTVMKRIARWVDHRDPYMTMSKDFMDGVWSVFHMLHMKGLVYESKKVVPYSPGLETPISNFEASENYKTISRDAVYVGLYTDAFDGHKTMAVVWTTLPWTFIPQMSIGVKSDMEYIRIVDKLGRYIIVSKGSVNKLFDKKEYTILDSFCGSFLIGKSYVPIFDFYKNVEDIGLFKFIDADFIEQDSGTGLVSLAPAFGVDDWEACNKAGINFAPCPIDSKCRFTGDIKEYAGLNVYDSNDLVIKFIQSKGQLIKKESITHRFPFCPRSEQPLVYRVVDSWFLDVEKIKQSLIVNNKMINWLPDHIGTKRFHNWLSNAKDWAISRNRFWGTPIPVWKNRNGDVFVPKNSKELEELLGFSIDDMHREYIDCITLKINGEEYKRCEQVFDCWFESGSMPIGQVGSYYDNMDEIMKSIPADFVSEGIDQTRGWFYTLNVISTALFNVPAFKNVIVNGTVLSRDGTKMSKRLKNYPELLSIVDTVGADAVRMYLLKSPACNAEDIKFDESGCTVIIKSFLIPLWQSYKFFITYAEMYSYSNDLFIDQNLHYLDALALKELSNLISDVAKSMNNYDIDTTILKFEYFVDFLTNWYIRLSRIRFWEEATASISIGVLRNILFELSKLTAPYLPFISEYIYQRTKTQFDPESVHLSSFPKYVFSNIEFENIDTEMSLIRKIVHFGRKFRKSMNIRGRMPLKSITIISNKDMHKEIIDKYREIILNELNVDDIVFENNISNFVRYKVLPNYKELGAMLGSRISILVKKLEDFSLQDVDSLLDGGDITIDVDGVFVTLNTSNLVIQFESVNPDITVVGSGDIYIFMNTETNEELLMRGMARDIVNAISMMRKSKKYPYDAMISIDISTNDNDIINCINTYKNKIFNDTQCNSLSIQNEISDEMSLFEIGESQFFANIKLT